MMFKNCCLYLCCCYVVNYVDDKFGSLNLLNYDRLLNCYGLLIYYDLLNYSVFILLLVY